MSYILLLVISTLFLLFLLYNNRTRSYKKYIERKEFDQRFLPSRNGYNNGTSYNFPQQRNK